MTLVKTVTRGIVVIAASWVLAACGGGGSGGGGANSVPSAPAITLGSNSVSFGNQLQNTTSASRTVTITNSGTATLTVSSITVTGTNASSFAETNTCTSVPAGGNCSVSLSFTPATIGALTATLSIVSNVATSPSTVSLSGQGITNALAATVDVGPSLLTGAAVNPGRSVNTLYVSITVCTPGSTSQCQVIDHVEVDTGSVGLRLMSQVLSSAKPTPAKVGSNALNECVQFADGYTWGSVGALDVQLGGQTIPSVAVNVMGDPAAGTVPADCSTLAGGATPGSYLNESDVYDFGANGVLGIGNFLQDCGPACASSVQAGTYYSCSANSCAGTTLSLSSQVQNPASLLSGGINTGVVVSLPPVTTFGTLGSPGANSLNGYVYFGINTTASNTLGAQGVYTVNASGELSTTFLTTTLASSIIDSGSNAYFFPDAAIPNCPSLDEAAFFCPASQFAGSATITGSNGVATSVVSFAIDNAANLFQDYTGTLIADGSSGCTSVGGCVGLSNVLSVLPTLGGSNGSGVLANAFDWGLPFFYGRPVYVLFEPASGTSGSGPAIAF